MAIISGVVRLDGLGDYTNISSGITDLVASGLADSSITEYYIYVNDAGPYSGYINTAIPNSGTLYLLGQYSRWIITEPSSISGISDGMYTFVAHDMLLDGASLNTYMWDQPSGSAYNFSNVDFIRTNYGINSDQTSITLTNVSSTGNQSGNFIKGVDTSISINDSSISKYEIGISGNEIYLVNSKIHHNDYNLLLPTGSLSAINSLIYEGDYGVYISNGTIMMSNSTISSDIPIYATGTYASITSSIMSGVTECLHGNYLVGSTVIDSILCPSGWSSPNISGTNISTVYPQFNNPAYGDYRLVIDSANGSQGIEHEKISIPSGITISVDQSQFAIFDNKGRRNIYDFLPYIYKQGGTLRFTDYNKEIQFANMRIHSNPLEYSVIATVNYTAENINVLPSFDINPPSFGGIDLNPWDWDYMNLDKETSKIEVPTEYIIPRSHVNIEQVIGNNLNFLPENHNILFNKMTKNNIKVWNSIDFRGVSYDPLNSRINESILWVIDGRQQNLIKHSAFTGEDLYTYPILATNPSGRAMIRPSGVTFIGVDNDKYRFIKDGTTEEIKGYSEYGDFLWFPTDINTRYDVRGVYSYKDYLFVTASQYSRDIYNRTIVPSGGAYGQVLFYFNNENYTHYLYDHKTFNLASGHSYPTDMTIYEDGTFLSLDYYSSENIYVYKPGYDYAMIQTQYDKNTRVLLREQYNDVNY